MDIIQDVDISTFSQAPIACDNLEEMLMNVGDLEAYLKKLKDSCINFHTKVECSILESISKSSECVRQLEKSSAAIIGLTNQKKELKASLENIKLEQKVIEKKAINIITETEKTKVRIESMKEQREKLTLEIVDLEEDTKSTKENMKKQWNALKKACMVYKNLLDIHIDTEEINHVEHITVKFFWSENPTDKKFFIVLTCQDNCWKVNKFEPELSMEEKYQLNHVVQFSKLLEVANVTLLLCELRKLYLKNYFEN